MVAKFRILCVDDETHILNVVRRQLEDEDYEIFTADSAEKGLVMLKENAPVHIILSDYRMPCINGVEFLKKVLKISQYTVGIIFSGYTDEDALKDHIKSGLVFRYLNKPWDIDDLITTLQDAEKQVKLNMIGSPDG